MGCVNTISKEMGPFSALSEWNEWINFHSKWISNQPGHSIWVPFALDSHSIWAIFSPFNMGHLQHKFSLTTLRWELCFALKILKKVKLLLKIKNAMPAWGSQIF